jgi:branched-chain amino acid transport system permease protein
MDYFINILITILLYVMLSQSLTLTAGYSGLISLAHAGFYGIGAYTTAILSVNFGLPFLITLPLAILLSGIIAVIVSVIALRTVDDYFIIITLGIQVIAFSIMNNWMSLTNGPLGITGIHSISILGFEFNSKLPFLLLVIFFVCIVFYIIRNITKSPFGQVLIALSEDEIFTQSLGKKVYISKVASFTIGAMLAAIPGVLYAHYITYIDPTSFTVNESIFILSIVIIGGMRNLWGVAFAAAFLVLLPEVLRYVGMPDGIAANMRQIIYGIILIAVMMMGKNGIKKSLVIHNNKKHETGNVVQ